MFYYVKRADNGDCLTVSEDEIPLIETPINKFKKYKVLLKDTKDLFDVSVIFSAESREELKNLIDTQRPSLPPSSFIESASDLTDIERETDKVEVKNTQLHSLLERKLQDLKSVQVSRQITTMNEQSNVLLDVTNIKKEKLEEIKNKSTRMEMETSKKKNNSKKRKSTVNSKGNIPKKKNKTDFETDNFVRDNGSDLLPMVSTINHGNNSYADNENEKDMGENDILIPKKECHENSNNAQQLLHEKQGDAVVNKIKPQIISVEKISPSIVDTPVHADNLVQNIVDTSNKKNDNENTQESVGKEKNKNTESAESGTTSKNTTQHKDKTGKKSKERKHKSKKAKRKNTSTIEKQLKKELKDALEQIEQYKAMMEHKDKEIVSLKQRNMDLQTKILEKMDEYASKKINPFESIAKGDISVGYTKSDGSIHCGNDIYISKINYDNAKNKLIGKKDYAPFVKEVAVAIVGLTELKAGSVTGRPCNRTGGPAKPKINPAKLGAVYGIFRHYLLTDQNLDPLSTDIEVKKVSEYVAQKIADLNRKKRKTTEKSNKKSERDSEDTDKKGTKNKETSDKEEQKNHKNDDENTPESENNKDEENKKDEKREVMGDVDSEKSDESDEEDSDNSEENSESDSSKSE